MEKPRYIDAEKVKVHFLTAYPLLQRERLMNTIDGVPTADVQEVKHGTWTNKRTMLHDGETYCSLCDWESDVKFKYCPNCGARMDGDEK